MNRRTLTYIILIIVVIILVGVTGYFIFVKNQSHLIKSIECNEGEIYSWQNGADSVQKYLDVKKSLANITSVLNCKCNEPDCYTCRGDGDGMDIRGYYAILYIDGKFIVWRQYVVTPYNTGGDEYYDFFEYSSSGQKISTICSRIPKNDVASECKFVFNKNYDNYIERALSRIYFSGRKDIVTNLNSIDKFQNQLFDMYVKLGRLKPEDKISDIYQIMEKDEKESEGIYTFNNDFFVPMEGGEVFTVEQYSFNGDKLDPYCENTWAIGGGGETNRNCKLPAGSITAKKYLDLIRSTCK